MERTIERSLLAELSFSGRYWLAGNYVYAWRRGDEWLYVGCTTTPGRVFRHNQIGRQSEPVRPDDQFTIWAFPTWELASAYEADLLSTHRPRLSEPQMMVFRRCRIVPCIGCGRRFKQKRWWQKFHSRDCQRGLS